jgi:trimeric autotransporter adhesin
MKDQLTGANGENREDKTALLGFLCFLLFKLRPQPLNTRSPSGKNKIHFAIPTLRFALGLALLATLNSRPSALFAQGTAFTYQGRLSAGTGVANGNYDMQFYLRDALAPPGNPVGNTNTIAPVAVSNGLFTVVLDFGANFPGADRWLEIGVRTNGSAGAYTTLSPRQPLTPTPYAMTASNLSGTLPASQLSGTLPSALFGGTYSGAVTLNNAADSFSGNGAGLSSLNANSLSSGTVADSRLAANIARVNQVWLLNGNAGTTPGANLLGTTDNQALELKVKANRALRLEPTVDDSTHSNVVNVVGGALFNLATPGVHGATIAGGGGGVGILGLNLSNQVSADFGSIGGGTGNTSSGRYGTVGGGYGNTSSSNSATGGGGYLNRSSGEYATIGGGGFNASSSQYATVGGGFQNSSSNSYASVGGGYQNSSGGQYATVAGGIQNSSSNDYATVSGGYLNTCSGRGAAVGGGLFNLSSGGGAFVGGGGTDGSFISGNVASGNASTVAGGFGNASGGDYSTVSGGHNNHASGGFATIGGGNGNSASLSCTVAGGEQNITGAGFASAIGGGYANSALGNYATVGGGEYNAASGPNSTVPGGYNNSAGGANSFAAGLNAQANHARCFIWSSYPNSAPTFGPDTFFVSATNGIGINCGAQRGDGGGQYWLNLGNVIGSDLIETSTGAHLTTAGIWSNASDKNRKTGFTPVSGREILEKLSALPVRQWRYTNELSSVRHLGPTAQDFKAAFGLGTDDKSIGTVDEEGVALAAIQGLNQKVEQQRAENAELKQELTELKNLINSLNQKLNGGAK